MDKRLQSRTALVTGAGNGIGKAIALKLAALGAAVVVNDLGTSVEGEGSSSGPADAAVAEILAAGGAAVANYDSIAESGGCERAIQTAIDAFGACDIVIANAGALSKTAALGLKSDDESWRKLLDLYLGQKFWLTRTALPAMVERGWGRLIFATSEIARGTQKNPLGAAVLSGAIGMMRDLALNHRNTGVTFNCYAPGAVTRTYDHYRKQVEAGLIDQVLPPEAMGAQRGPEFVAPMIAWLCSDQGANVTGEVFSLSGGTITRWGPLQNQVSVIKPEGAGYAPWGLTELDSVVPQLLSPI